MMDCPACGHHVSKKAATCPTCGHRIAFGVIMFWAVFSALLFSGFLGALVGSLGLAIYQLANMH